MNNDFGSLVMRFADNFHSWLRHSWKSLVVASFVTQKALFTVTHALFCIYFIMSSQSKAYFNMKI